MVTAEEDSELMQWLLKANIQQPKQALDLLNQYGIFSLLQLIHSEIVQEILRTSMSIISRKRFDAALCKNRTILMEHKYNPSHAASGACILAPPSPSANGVCIHPPDTTKVSLEHSVRAEPTSFSTVDTAAAINHKPAVEVADVDLDPIIGTEKWSTVSDLDRQVLLETFFIEYVIHLKCGEPVGRFTSGLYGEAASKNVRYNSDYVYKFSRCAHEKLTKSIEAHQERAKRLIELIDSRKGTGEGRLKSSQVEWTRRRSAKRSKKVAFDTFVVPISSAALTVVPETEKVAKSPPDSALISEVPITELRRLERIRLDAIKSAISEPTITGSASNAEVEIQELRRQEKARLKALADQSSVGQWQCEHCKMMNKQDTLKCCACNQWMAIVHSHTEGLPATLKGFRRCTECKAEKAPNHHSVCNSCRDGKSVSDWFKNARKQLHQWWNGSNEVDAVMGRRTIHTVGRHGQSVPSSRHGKKTIATSTSRPYVAHHPAEKSMAKETALRPLKPAQSLSVGLQVAVKQPSAHGPPRTPAAQRVSEETPTASYRSPLAPNNCAVEEKNTPHVTEYMCAGGAMEVVVEMDVCENAFDGVAAADTRLVFDVMDVVVEPVLETSIRVPVHGKCSALQRVDDDGGFSFCENDQRDDLSGRTTTTINCIMNDSSKQQLECALPPVTTSNASAEQPPKIHSEVHLSSLPEARPVRDPLPSPPRTTLAKNDCTLSCTVNRNHFPDSLRLHESSKSELDWSHLDKPAPPARPQLQAAAKSRMTEHGFREDYKRWDTDTEHREYKQGYRSESGQQYPDAKESVYAEHWY